MKLGKTLIMGTSLLALTYSTSVFSQEFRFGFEPRREVIIQQPEFDYDFDFEPDIIIGGYALGYYNPGYGYWTGTEWDEDYYDEGHRGYGHYYRGAPESVHQQYNRQGREHPNEAQRTVITQKQQNKPEERSGTTNSTIRNDHEQRPASQPKEAQQSDRKVEQNNIKHNNSNNNTNSNKLRAAPQTKEPRTATEDHKSDKPEKK